MRFKPFTILIALKLAPQQKIENFKNRDSAPPPDAITAVETQHVINNSDLILPYLS